MDHGGSLLPEMIQFGSDIWVASGPQVSVAGFHYPTRMTVIQLDRRELLIWSPIALVPELKHAIEALGRVAYVVAPNTLHHLHMEDWLSAFPDATSLAPEALGKKRPDLRIDAYLEGQVPPAWKGEIELVAIRGNLITTEFVVFHRRSRTAVFTDLIQHFRPSEFKGWRRLVARLDLMAAPQPEVPRKFRTAFLDRRAARQALREILGWPVEKVIMAHAPTQVTGGHEFIARAFRWLRP